ncbi:hypothetical protein [Nocardioides kribbensis]|uniref:hypothetical protein n=1 Tax=Nocardioides kribbensis TaxID=305517 RepID=UPI0032DA0239
MCPDPLSHSHAPVETASGPVHALAAAPLPEDASPAARLRARAGRHVAWARRDGLGRLVEEDGLDPRERLAGAVSAYRWRRAHPRPAGSARAVLVVGVQRSGTNMVVRGIERDPSVEVHNENDRRAFARFQLRDDAVVRGVVGDSRHAVVLLKALCDSDRTAQLLDRLGPESRAVWVYRDVDGRAASAVAKFGDVNRRVLAEVAAAAAEGRRTGRWQERGLSPASLDLVRSLDPARLDPWSAAALFWLVRNRLLLEGGLHRRRDVHVVSYERTVADPEPSISAMARFLGLEPAPGLWSHVDARSVRPRRLDLDPRVRAACTALETELAAAADVSLRRQAQRDPRR